jgi:peptide/nickel transport system permease protein
MFAYILRRTLLMIPTVLGVLLLTFLLFNVVARDPARVIAGPKASEQQIEATRAKMGLNKPRFINLRHPADTQFFDLLRFKFPNSTKQDKPVLQIMKEKAPISLAIQLPAFLISLGAQLAISLFVASRRGSAVDYTVTFLCVASLAVPSLSLYLFLQWLLGAQLNLFPVAGWESGFYAVQYAALPVLCTVVLSLGGGIRFYRTVILEEVNADYVRTARAKGVSGSDALLVHVLRNVMIPTVTNTVTSLPFLMFGAIISERLFQIPGLGGLLVDAIFAQDHGVVMAVTYITAILYCAALLLSDILYTLADPRVSLE